jgi:hypothetical protein
MIVVMAAVILSASTGTAGPGFDPHMAKGGLPVCMDNLASCTTDLDACTAGLNLFQEDFANSQRLLEECDYDLVQAQEILTMCEEGGIVSNNSIGVPQTGQNDVYSFGDDGDLQAGVPWPDPRFVDNEDGTVTDNLTGLIWAKNTNSPAATTWYDALDICYNLQSDDIDLIDGSIVGDWRLPNIRELQSLMDYGQYNPVLPWDHPFMNVRSSIYWSSTTYAGSAAFAWSVSLSNGYHSPSYKGGNNGYVWCVRGGQ